MRPLASWLAWSAKRARREGQAVDSRLRGNDGGRLTTVLALDVGDRRIGVAASDPTGTLASPLTTIERTDEASDIESVQHLVLEHEATEIVVGMPFSLSGRRGCQARKVEEFTQALSGHTAIPVISVDERLSSVEAERMIRASGKRPSREKPLVDAVAAAVILQSYLDSSGGSG